MIAEDRRVPTAECCFEVQKQRSREALIFRHIHEDQTSDGREAQQDDDPEGVKQHQIRTHGKYDLELRSERLSHLHADEKLDPGVDGHCREDVLKLIVTIDHVPDDLGGHTLIVTQVKDLKDSVVGSGDLLCCQVLVDGDCVSVPNLLEAVSGQEEESKLVEEVDSKLVPLPVGLVGQHILHENIQRKEEVEIAEDENIADIVRECVKQAEELSFFDFIIFHGD